MILTRHWHGIFIYVAECIDHLTLVLWYIVFWCSHWCRDGLLFRCNTKCDSDHWSGRNNQLTLDILLWLGVFHTVGKYTAVLPPILESSWKSREFCSCVFRPEKSLRMTAVLESLIFSYSKFCYFSVSFLSSANICSCFYVI